MGDLNNLKPEKNAVYKEVISNLENFVMIKWDGDETIIPRESSFFEFYTLGQDVEVTPLEESEMYREDWLGLRTLDESGRLHKFTLSGGHMNMQFSWFKENVVKP